MMMRWWSELHSETKWRRTFFPQRPSVFFKCPSDFLSILLSSLVFPFFWGSKINKTISSCKTETQNSAGKITPFASPAVSGRLRWLETVVPVWKIEIERKKILKNQKSHILDTNSRGSATTLFMMAMRSHVIWRHIDRYFGGPLYCQSLDRKYWLKPSETLQDLKIAQIKEKMITVLKLFGPCGKERYFL